MAKSNYTKKTKHKIWMLRTLDMLILVMPILTFFVMGLSNGETLVYQKVTLIGTAAVTLILTVFNILAKTHLRSIIWIMVIGFYVAIDNIFPVIATLAATSIADEFFIVPMIKKLTMKYNASEVMDERGIE